MRASASTRRRSGSTLRPRRRLPWPPHPVGRLPGCITRGARNKPSPTWNKPSSIFGDENLPEDPAILLTLIEIRLGQQLQLPSERRRWGEVENLLGRAERAKSGAVEDSNYRRLYAEYLHATNKVDAALRLLDEATENDDRKVPATWITLASLLDRQNRRADAIRALDRGMAGDAAGDRVSLRWPRLNSSSATGKVRLPARSSPRTIRASSPPSVPSFIGPWETCSERWAIAKGPVSIT